jgi:hypothetical protein
MPKQDISDSLDLIVWIAEEFLGVLLDPLIKVLGLSLLSPVLCRSPFFWTLPAHRDDERNLETIFGWVLHRLIQASVLLEMPGLPVLIFFQGLLHLFLSSFHEVSLVIDLVDEIALAGFDVGTQVHSSRG